ncbi:MAG: thioredoxin [Myxococcales bacterium]|nr:MAG: thioredoxin [Myxococcales bacterium]
MPIQTVTEQNFQAAVLQAELPVLVDLYADWCQPCKIIEPILNELALELEGKLKIVRVDVDASPMIAQGFRVQSIPMLVLINEGRAVDQLTGAVDKQALLTFIKPVLPAGSPEFSPKDLAVLIRQNKVLPVDIRDPSSYARFRIPSAINLPEADIEKHLDELAPNDGKQRVLYGRGTDEARDLAERLQKMGVPVAFLNGGFLHWETDELEVERG